MNVISIFSSNTRQESKQVYFHSCWNIPLNQGTGLIGAHTPALGHTICSTDASTFCWLSRPMKLILFICMFVSVDTGCYPSFPPCPRHTVSGMSVLCARYSFHASFVASQALLINKTPFFFASVSLTPLGECVCVGCQTTHHQRLCGIRWGVMLISISAAVSIVRENNVELITNFTITHLGIISTSINKSVNLIVLGLRDDGVLDWKMVHFNIIAGNGWTAMFFLPVSIYLLVCLCGRKKDYIRIAQGQGSSPICPECTCDGRETVLTPEAHTKEGYFSVQPGLSYHFTSFKDLCKAAAVDFLCIFFKEQFL